MIQDNILELSKETIILPSIFIIDYRSSFDDERIESIINQIVSLYFPSENNTGLIKISESIERSIKIVNPMNLEELKLFFDYIS